MSKMQETAMRVIGKDRIWFRNSITKYLKMVILSIHSIILYAFIPQFKTHLYQETLEIIMQANSFSRLIMQVVMILQTNYA